MLFAEDSWNYIYWKSRVKNFRGLQIKKVFFHLRWQVFKDRALRRRPYALLLLHLKLGGALIIFLHLSSCLGLLDNFMWRTANFKSE
jgi:hypothetical protein